MNGKSFRRQRFKTSLNPTDTKKIFKTFEDKSETQRLDYTIANLNVEPIEDAPYVYDLSFVANDPDESKLFLNSLIVFYQDYLEKTCQNEMNREVRELKSKSEKLNAVLQKLESSKQQLRDKYPELLFTQDDLSKREYQIRQKALKRVAIQNELESIDQLLSEHTVTEVVWILQNQNKLESTWKGKVDIERLKEQVSNAIKTQAGKKKNDQYLAVLNRCQKRIENENSEDELRGLATLLLHSKSRINEYEFLHEDLREEIPEYTKLRAAKFSTMKAERSLKSKDAEIAEIRQWCREANGELVKLDPDHLDLLLKANDEVFRFSVLLKPGLGKKFHARKMQFAFGGAVLGGLSTLCFVALFLVLRPR